MEVGDLVRDKKSDLLGYVTNIRNNWCGSNWATVYWAVIEVEPTWWINTDNLEVLDGSR